MPLPRCFSQLILFTFSESSGMEPNIFNGSKADFTYFITMALRKKMSWNTLKILLIDVASSLEETREVISILLRELETLHSILEKKDKELEKYRIDGFTVETQKNEVEDQNYFSETETIPDNSQENEQQNYEIETETMDDEIEILDVVKESINEEKDLKMDECSNLYRKHENENNDLGEADCYEFLNEIDNGFYHLFVTS